MTRTPEEPITIRRDGFCWPRRIAPASRTLPNSSSNICLFTAELLFDDFGEPRNPGAAAFSSRSHGHANLAYATTTSDESAELWMRSDPGLKFAIFLIA
jgi:hypothetical protein